MWLSMNDSISTTNASILANSSQFDKEIYAIVATVSAVSGFISLLASSFIIFIICLFKKWRFFSQRLVLYLAITAAIFSLTAMLLRLDYYDKSGTNYTHYCILIGCLNQIASWMVLDAIICITMSLLLKSFSDIQLEKYEALIVLFIFVFPLTFNWIPFIKKSYGIAGAWCWIRSVDNDTGKKFVFGQILQLVLWYLPLYACLVVLIVLYVIIIIKLHHIRKRWTGKYDPQTEKVRQQIMKETVSLLAYPLIYFFINIPPLINRIHGAVEPENPQPVLWFLSAIFFPLQGTIIALAFSLDPETRRRLTVANFRAAFRECCEKERIEEYSIKDVTLTESLR